jgi:hypothetical protein
LTSPTSSSTCWHYGAGVRFGKRSGQDRLLGFPTWTIQDEIRVKIA